MAERGILVRPLDVNMVEGEGTGLDYGRKLAEKTVTPLLETQLTPTHYPDASDQHKSDHPMIPASLPPPTHPPAYTSPMTSVALQSPLNPLLAFCPNLAWNTAQ